MIKVKNITLKYEKDLIFENTDIEIPENKLTIILGLNGVGKTSLLKILKRELLPNSEMENLPEKIFYLPQKIDYTEGLTSMEYLSSVFYKNSYKWFLDKNEEEKITEVLVTFGLENKQNTRIETLSAGELQKLNIALGILSEADLLLLDEPTSNLDLVNQIQILDKIKNLSADTTVVIVMHDLRLALKYGDYFVAITPEHKIIHMKKEGFIKKENLDEIYGLDFQVVQDEKNIINIDY